MKKILFICHGNVGRSPSAEFIFKDLVRKAGLADRFVISSAGTSAGAVGIPFDPNSKQQLVDHGIPCEKHFARQMTNEDYADYDMIIGMDIINHRDLFKMTNNDPQNKVSLLLDYTDRKGDEIDDPWYTRDFAKAFREIKEGCEGLLKTLREEMQL